MNISKLAYASEKVAAGPKGMLYVTGVVFGISAVLFIIWFIYLRNKK